MPRKAIILGVFALFFASCTLAAPIPVVPQNCPVAPSDLAPTAPDLAAQGVGARTLYIMPTGSLTDRLSAIASAATLARRRDMSMVVVWPEGGDVDFAASWDDLYQAPALPLGPFPSGKFSRADPGCTAHPVKTYEDFVAIQNKWEDFEGRQVLCVVSSNQFTADAHSTNWFYKLLVPSKPVLDLEAPFTQYHQWEKWGQWIGVHICRSQDCVAAAAVTGTSAPQVSDFLALAKEFSEMPLDGEAVPRFFIVSEDAVDESALQRDIWALDLMGAKGTALTFPAKARKTQPHSLAGLRETVAHLHLLSRATLIIGTQGSAFSKAAAAQGGAYLVYAGTGRSIRSALSPPAETIAKSMAG